MHVFVDPRIVTTVSVSSARSVAHLNFESKLISSSASQVGYDKADNEVRVKINPRYYRPTEVEFLLGDASKAEKALGWQPKIKFEALVKDMVQSDIEMMRKSPNA